jgi:phage N-6-adenine-methyltransferase
MINRGLFSSNSDEWETPQEFFDAVNEIFHFDLDVCASPANAKCNRYFSKIENGLLHPWKGICWMNPPYGREIGLWVKKAYESNQKEGTVVVCLLPARTDTKWWHEYVVAGAESINFIKGRLHFSQRGTAPFPSVLVVFDNKRHLILNALCQKNTRKEKPSNKNILNLMEGEVDGRDKKFDA